MRRADEWSGDGGVGVQYFSQQAVGRLLEPAGIELPRRNAAAGEARAGAGVDGQGRRTGAAIYQTIGAYFGYAVAGYADFYDVRHVLVLGRVMTGEGGDAIVAEAERVLREEFPELAGRIRLHVPGEKEKRHGQAMAAASLPAIPEQEKSDAVRFITPARIGSFRMARPATRRSRAPRTCAFRRTRTISKSWPTTASRSVSAARTSGSRAWW